MKKGATHYQNLISRCGLKAGLKEPKELEKKSGALVGYPASGYKRVSGWGGRGVMGTYNDVSDVSSPISVGNELAIVTPLERPNLGPCKWLFGRTDKEVQPQRHICT
eukprot:1183769-Prorocentrum_minimum.AAC.3